jgi:DNA-binding XRE family transcriptional regulator
MRRRELSEGLGRIKIMLDELRRVVDQLPLDWVRAEPGWQLRALREELGVSQRRLADQADVRQSEISRLERGGDACLSTWRRLFAGLGWDAVLVPALECEETAAWLRDTMEERRERRRRGLCTGRRRFV